MRTRIAASQSTSAPAAPACFAGLLLTNPGVPYLPLARFVLQDGLCGRHVVGACVSAGAQDARVKVLAGPVSIHG